MQEVQVEKEAGGTNSWGQGAGRKSVKWWFTGEMGCTLVWFASDHRSLSYISFIILLLTHGCLCVFEWTGCQSDWRSGHLACGATYWVQWGPGISYWSECGGSSPSHGA